jgi:hypothetical protein
MKSELYILVLGDDPSYHLDPCHLWKWFLLALEHERNSSFALLNLLWLRAFCPCFPAKTQHFQMHIRSWTCYVISVPSGGLVVNHNRNQCITSTLGWRKFTINISPILKPCSSSISNPCLKGKSVLPSNVVPALSHSWWGKLLSLLRIYF